MDDTEVWVVFLAELARLTFRSFYLLIIYLFVIFALAIYVANSMSSHFLYGGRK